MTRKTINIGPYHPLQEEAEKFELTVEGETVIDIDVRLSYNHRGIEKLCEQHHWDGAVFVVERICGICSTSHPFAYVNAVEDCANRPAPIRAQYIRTIIAELERIHSHLLWVGLAGHFIGYNTVFMWAWKYREEICDILEEITGNRQSYAMFTPGGVRRDIDPQIIPSVNKRLNYVDDKVKMLAGAIMNDPVLHARLKGVGVLSRDDAIAYSALGPTARPSGVDKDVRRDHPYGAYDKVDFSVITRTSGDVYAKAVARVLEMLESTRIIRQCLADLPAGPINAELKNIPAGVGIGTAEAPRGEVIHITKSDGSSSPVRHKVRAPTFMNLPTFKASIPGQTISDAALVLASIDPCYCCTERMTAVETDGRIRHDANELVRMCQNSTRQLESDMGRKLGEGCWK